MHIFGYADDIAVTSVTNELHQIEATPVTTLAKIKSWLKSANFQLAGKETEAIMELKRIYDRVRIIGRTLPWSSR